MVSNRDLILGVERGIISQDQLAQLVSLSSTSEPEIKPLEQNPETGTQDDVDNAASDDIQEAQDEAPRFIRSFGDLFIAIGTGFLGAGLIAAVSYLGDTPASQLGALVVIWLAAEWLTGYLRISAPSIVLSILFTAFSAYYVSIYFNLPILGHFSSSSEFKTLMVMGMSSMLAAGLFYARFRLPFSLAIIGLTTVCLILAIIGTISSDFLLSNFRWIIGLGGLELFAAAMWFDFKDPLRVTRRSDCGFWLHLIAAPMLTHAILWDSHPAISGLKKMIGADVPANSWMIIAAFFVLFGIIALIINRRALLIASLGYVGSVIAYGIWNLQLPAGAATSIVLLVIATLILSFGVGWQPLRRLLFMLLPRGKYTDKLPPAYA